MSTHNIKSNKKFASDVGYGRKCFEVRFNDRDYQVGDLVQFTVVDDTGNKIGSPLDNIMYKITYVLSGYGLQDGYVAFGIKRLETLDDNRLHSDDFVEGYRIGYDVGYRDAEINTPIRPNY